MLRQQKAVRLTLEVRATCSSTRMERRQERLHLEIQVRPSCGRSGGLLRLP